MATVTTSKQFSINLNDFWKGLIVATLTAPITILVDSFSKGVFTIDWKTIGSVALTGLLGYLLKNFFSPAVSIVSPAATGSGTTNADVTVTPKP